MKLLAAWFAVLLGISVSAIALAADKPGTKAKDKPAEPVGMLLERAEGGFINLKVDDGNFVVAVLDADKKEIACPYNRAFVRYRKYGNTRQFVLAPSENGKTLRSPQTIPDRPYFFTGLSLVLFTPDSEQSAFAKVFFFKQAMPGDDATISAEQLTPEQAQRAQPAGER